MRALRCKWHILERISTCKEASEDVNETDADEIKMDFGPQNISGSQWRVEESRGEERRGDERRGERRIKYGQSVAVRLPPLAFY